MVPSHQLPDPIIARIALANETASAGDRRKAREMFSSIWLEIGEQLGDPLHRCALAHAMADVQDDVREELHWDRQALDAAELVTDQRATDAGVIGGASAMLPSLHLNLADCYRRLGDRAKARHHLSQGRASLRTLGADGYAQFIRHALDRLAGKLNTD
jgi:hypothetical protein